MSFSIHPIKFISKSTGGAETIQVKTLGNKNSIDKVYWIERWTKSEKEEGEGWDG